MYRRARVHIPRPPDQGRLAAVTDRLRWTDPPEVHVVDMEGRYYVCIDAADDSVERLCAARALGMPPALWAHDPRAIAADPAGLGLDALLQDFATTDLGRIAGPPVTVGDVAAAVVLSPHGAPRSLLYATAGITSAPAGRLLGRRSPSYGCLDQAGHLWGAGDTEDGALVRARSNARLAVREAGPLGGPVPGGGWRTATITPCLAARVAARPGRPTPATGEGMVGGSAAAVIRSPATSAASAGHFVFQPGRGIVGAGRTYEEAMRDAPDTPPDAARPRTPAPPAPPVPGGVRHLVDLVWLDAHDAPGRIDTAWAVEAGPRDAPALHELRRIERERGAATPAGHSAGMGL